MSLLRTALAFLRRDVLVTTSYRLNVVLGLLAVAASLLFLSYITDFVGPMIEAAQPNFISKKQSLLPSRSRTYAP